MASYSGQSNKVKAALMTMVTQITLDRGSGSEPAFVAVRDNAFGSFDGYPLVRVLPGDLQTVKTDVGANERTLVFDLFVHVPLEDSEQTQTTSYSQMYDLTDLLLDTLDAGDFHGALTQIDSTIGTFILNATRGDWTVVPSNGGSVLVCDVNVEIRYSKDFY